MTPFQSCSKPCAVLTQPTELMTWGPPDFDLTALYAERVDARLRSL